MTDAPTEQQCNTPDGPNTLQKAIHSFVFGGETPSKETETRTSFVQSFLAAYYNTALQGGSVSCANPSVLASSCNTTTTCTTNSPCNVSTTTNEVHNYDSSAESSARTEFLNTFKNISDEAERRNSMRDMASRLAERLGGMYKGLTDSNFVKSALQLPNQVHNSPSNKEVEDLSQHLQLFVDNINESLHLLGTTDLTEEELKLLLATAPLPSIGNNNTNNNDEVVQRQRSQSVSEMLNNRCTTPANLASRGLRHSVSEGVAIASFLDENATPPRGGRSSSGYVTPKKRLSSFLSKKMESLTNLLESIEFSEKEDPQKIFTKSQSFNFGYGGDKTLTPPMSGYSTPRSGYDTPRSGYDTPYSCDYDSPRSSGIITPAEDNASTAALKLKVELAEKALCDEVVVRTAAEQRVASLSDIVSRLKTDLDQVQSQKDTVGVINKQMSVELRFLRQRNSAVTRDRQQWEDALVGETKKRRMLEEQMQMLIKTYKDKATNIGQTVLSGLSHKQQEAVFAQQREEVLLAVIESLRAQLYTADSEMEAARNEWQEERARYQETHDLLRFQLDQLTLTRSSQIAKNEDPEFDEKVDEIVRNTERKNSIANNKSNITSCSADTKEKPIAMHERMKLFFLSSSWWPKLDFLSNSSTQPVRPPVLLMQIAWWISELREYATTNHISMRFLAHANQFCNCDECVNHIAKYAISG